MPTTIQQFCSKWGLPELHHLVESDYADRHVVIWQIMQKRLSHREQRDFLLEFCQQSRVHTLNALGSIIKPDMSAEDCSSLMLLITAVAGFDKDALSDAMRAFCDRKKLHSLSVLSERFGAEEVVYRIAALFPVRDDEMRDELDALKFEANAKRFCKELNQAMVQNQAVHTKEMGALNVKLAALEATRAALQQKMDVLGLAPIKRVCLRQS